MTRPSADRRLIPRSWRTAPVSRHGALIAKCDGFSLLTAAIVHYIGLEVRDVDQSAGEARRESSDKPNRAEDCCRRLICRSWTQPGQTEEHIPLPSRKVRSAKMRLEPSNRRIAMHWALAAMCGLMFATQAAQAADRKVLMENFASST